MSALLPLFFDTALKGFILLALAAILALALFKASAATRHHVWLVAIVAVLVVPVLSVTLPKWQLLPVWTSDPIVEPVAQRGPTQSHPIKTSPEASPIIGTSPILPMTSAPASPDPGSSPTTSETLVTPPKPEISEGKPHGWWIPWVWLTGFGLIGFRLLLGRFLMRRIASRRCVPVDDESLTTVFESCRAEMGVRQRVVLLLDPKRTIPLVWGIIRPRLLVPAEALEWDGDRLRAVLLHELGHLKRRDTVSQLLAQVACALHWWNPLVWLASWRLYVERERACDDLVLSNGIRPSAYAEHLLHVATRLSPSPWTQGCGIAMARRSSLEGRLLAVLSRDLNRRRVSRLLGGAVMLLGAAIAVPLSMLRAQDEKPDEGTTDQGPVIQVNNEDPQPPSDKFKGYFGEGDERIPETSAPPKKKRRSGDYYSRVSGDGANRAKAASQPKVERQTANAPGRYELGTKTELIVTHLVIGDERINIARIAVRGGSTDEPYDIVLPDNGIYALAWEVNSDVLWLLTASSVKQYHYAEPGEVIVSTLKPAEIGRVEFSSLEFELGNALGHVASAASNLLPNANLEHPASSRDAALAAAKIYWGGRSSAMASDYNPGEPFDPVELARLTKPREDGENGTARWDRLRRLSWLINRAGAEKATQFRYLLEDDELKKDKSIALALAGYDYSVNGNRDALKLILDSLAEEPKGSDSQEIVSLGFIDEWDVTIAAYEKHFSEGSDGAGSMCRAGFWLTRQCLFPEQFDRFQARKRESEESE